MLSHLCNGVQMKLLDCTNSDNQWPNRFSALRLLKSQTANGPHKEVNLVPSHLFKEGLASLYKVGFADV